jgi:ribose transport system substrate-binding protein
MRTDRYPARGTAVTLEEKHSMKKHRTAGLLAVIGAIAVVVGACSTAPGASPAASGGGSGPYTVGISNPGSVGNGWREAMICSAKAQAVEEGDITSVTTLSEKTDANGQLAQIRDLTTKAVDIMLINPADMDSLNPAIEEALAAGITVIAIDAPVSAEGAYNLSNDQEEYAYLGAKWLFEKLGGEGKVVYMRGAAGHPADNDRDKGFKRALEENPGIEVVAETQTGWDQKTGTDQINEILSGGTEFDGVWTSGIDNVIVEALENADHLVPVVGADNAGFVEQLLTIDGFEGAAVTNPPAVGGAGVVLGKQILAGDKPEDANVHVTPELWDNTTDEGKAKLEAAQIEGLPDIWPLGLTVADWTTYEPEAVVACKGPGE